MEFLKFDGSKERGKNTKDPLTKVLLGFFASLFTLETGFMRGSGKSSFVSKLFR